MRRSQRIIDREDDYRRHRRLDRIISPERHDPFATGEATPDPSIRTYGMLMLMRNRWDQSHDGDAAGAKKAKTASDWDAPDATPGIGRWDATPRRVGDETPSVRRNRWDETPTPGRMADADATPAAGSITPGATPSGAWDATPKLPGGLVTLTPKKQRSWWDVSEYGECNTWWYGSDACVLHSWTNSVWGRKPCNANAWPYCSWRGDSGAVAARRLLVLWSFAG